LQDCPASVVVWGTQAFFTQSLPAGQPPQLTATPHASTVTTPHFPAHMGPVGWQVCEERPTTHDWPFAHGCPHAIVAPVQSV
jgi:hypothetical protein